MAGERDYGCVVMAVCFVILVLPIILAMTHAG
jgi:hypothetical protein